MTCNTSAVAVSLLQRLVALGITSVSRIWSSAMTCCGSANVLSGIALLCGPLGTDFRVDHTVIGTGHHRLSIGRVS